MGIRGKLGGLLNFIRDISFSAKASVVDTVVRIREINLTGVDNSTEVNGVDTTQLQETIENQSKPVIRSRGVEVNTEVVRGTSVSSITVELENHGEGVAEHLYLRPDISLNTSADPGEGHAFNLEDACFLLNDGYEFAPMYFALRRTDMDITDSSRKGAVLSPSDGVVEFTGQVELSTVRRHDRGQDRPRIPLLEATRLLSAAGNGRISVKVHVLYTDVNGRVHTEQVFGKMGPLQGGMTLEDISDFRYSVKNAGGRELDERIQDDFQYPP